MRSSSQIDLSRWNVANATDFTRIAVSEWRTGDVVGVVASNGQRHVAISKKKSAYKSHPFTQAVESHS
jgi:hypothetical protein